MRVRVYRNLHRSKLSVQHYIPGTGWRVRGDHRDAVALRNVNFIVNTKGRERVLRRRRKNVHAFVEGNLIEPSVKAYLACTSRAKYDPYTAGYFWDVLTGKPVKTAAAAYIIRSDVYYTPKEKDKAE